MSYLYKPSEMKTSNPVTARLYWGPHNWWTALSFVLSGSACQPVLWYFVFHIGHVRIFFAAKEVNSIKNIYHTPTTTGPQHCLDNGLNETININTTCQRRECLDWRGVARELYGDRDGQEVAPKLKTNRIMVSTMAHATKSDQTYRKKTRGQSLSYGRPSVSGVGVIHLVVSL